MKEQNQGGGQNYNSQGTIISEDQEVNHGGYEEYESGAGAGAGAGAEAGGGLPARLPTEMMDVPADESPNPTDEEQEQPQADQQQYEAAQQAEEYGQEQEQEQDQQVLIEPEKQQQEEIGTSLTAEFAALDQEMAEQFYYINNDGRKCGPFSMEEVTQKYKSEEISDETQIWDGTQTKADATALKENKRIYSNLPRPPKRQQPAPKQEEPPKQEELVKPKAAEPAAAQGKTPNVSETKTNPPPQNGGGCCVVL